MILYDVILGNPNGGIEQEQIEGKDWIDATHRLARKRKDQPYHLLAITEADQ